MSLEKIDLEIDVEKIDLEEIDLQMAMTKTLKKKKPLETATDGTCRVPWTKSATQMSGALCTMVPHFQKVEKVNQPMQLLQGPGHVVQTMVTRYQSRCQNL